MDRSKHFREEAARYRSLANEITTPNPMKDHLEYIAEEFEKLAILEECQAEEVT